MRRQETVIGGFHVAVELHTPKSQEGPGVGITISGSVGGSRVEGRLHDLFSRGDLPVTGSQRRVRVPEPVIAEIDEWCMQFTI